MAVSITIRAVPDDVRNELAVRAARSGRSLQEYLMGELIELAQTPSLDEVIREVRTRAVTFPPLGSDEILGDLRAERL